MRELWTDIKLAREFLGILRVVRRKFPEKNLFQRVEAACEIMRQENVKAQLLFAIKHGPIQRAQ